VHLFGIIGALIGFVGYGMLGEDPITAKIALGIGAVLVFAWGVAWWEERRALRFHEWLAQNRRAVQSGFGDYHGTHVTPDTTLTQFRFCASAIWVTETVPTGYFIRGHHNTSVAALFFSLLSLLAGWWGLPWGLIRTPQTIFRNLRGGTESRVSDLLGMPRSASGSLQLGEDDGFEDDIPEEATSSIDRNHTR
jgi:hypothetical protein